MIRALLACCGAVLLAGVAMAQPAPTQPAVTQPVPTQPAPTQPATVQPPAAAPDAWLPRGAAELLLLDKLRAQPATVIVRTGQSEAFGSLAITVRACVVRPPDQAQNAAAFLDIIDSRNRDADFHGWVLSNTPSVSQFQHPVFDLRLAGCR